MNPDDWDGPPCRDCPHGRNWHRPVLRRKRWDRDDCLYCPCRRYREKGLGLA